MHIYRADLKDLSACLTLNGSYETDYVWQVTQQEDGGEVITRFRPARLPRTMRVPYPSWGEGLLAHQERGDFILVAAEAFEVRGYIDQECQPDEDVAWIHHLVVGPPFRRRGIGETLLARAMQHARQQGLSHVMTVVQSKNYPGISFLQRRGFTFCGYNERYYRNQDIALYFACGL
jgi:ribosomal protein S18 acetylase RimI-like enzyme